MFIPLRCWVWVVGLALLDDSRPSAFFFFFFTKEIQRGHKTVT